jgi:hypothetical protein
MTRPRSILCGGIKLSSDDPLCVGRQVIHLNTQGNKANVNLVLEDLAKVFVEHLTPRLEDLMEIAAYVYATDCATVRGGKWGDEDATEPWSRDFQFVVPVRDPAFWSETKVRELLEQTLGFLSDDAYKFEFKPLTSKKQKQGYFEFGANKDWPFYKPERVIMFSGGLDSLAGTVETAAKGKNLVLVSHRPVAAQSSRQTKLFSGLQSAFPAVKMIHIPVWINKDKNIGREHTQRTRSFLYSALGTVVAASIQAPGVRFFENGVVSLNLPVADEVIGARASRTTHPQALQWFGQLYSLVLGRTLELDNPFFFNTKQEVIEIIAQRGQASLIGLTCSCAHQGFFQTKTQWHCGTCSQCIDRRIAILAAGQVAHDEEDDYVCNVFTGPRKEGYHRNMAVNYARHATELHRMGPEEMIAKFNTEISRAVRCMDKKSEAAQQIVKMHERHAEAVHAVLRAQIATNASGIIDGSVQGTSMIAMVMSQQHLVSGWRSYADRIIGILSKGVPPICQKKQPENEPRLQEIMDGLLKANEIELVREYPYMTWGSSLTKPDWSDESLGLWVEAKYARKKDGLAKISDAIAADITKYGDSQRRVLFVIYDPDRLIVDEQAFCEPIRKRPTMQVHILR